MFGENEIAGADADGAAEWLLGKKGRFTLTRSNRFASARRRVVGRHPPDATDHDESDGQPGGLVVGDEHRDPYDRHERRKEVRLSPLLQAPSQHPGVRIHHPLIPLEDQLQTLPQQLCCFHAAPPNRTLPAQAD
jgi:hypothetical protein